MPYAGNTNTPIDPIQAEKSYASLRKTHLYFLTQNAWTAPRAPSYVAKLLQEAPSIIETLQGKLAVVTGVTVGGAGYYIAQELACSVGMHVVLLGRNPTKLQQAVESIQKEASKRSKSVTLHTIQFDLNDLESAKKAAAECTKFATGTYERKLHVLINNAGANTVAYQTTAQGIEVNTGRNTIAPIVLTEQLLPMLKRAASASYKPRVHMVASLGHCFGNDIDLQRLLEFPEEGGAPEGVCQPQNDPVYQDALMGPSFQYGRAKYGLVLYCIAMQKKHPSINFTSCQPGSIASNFSKNLGMAGTIYYKGFYFFQYTASQGARAALRAALDPDCNEVESLQGAYLHADGNPWPPAAPTSVNPQTNEPYMLDEMAEQYVKTVAELIKKVG